MPKSYFIYNGIDCGIWNCYKMQPINFPSPTRDIDAQPVHGRNGELIIDNGRYTNVEVVIECLIKSDNFIADFDAMRAELLKDSDYHVLIDSLYPEEYRLASVRTVEAKTKTPMKGTVEIVLSCKPQRFLTAGDTTGAVIEGTATSSIIVADGRADDIFSTAFKNISGVLYPDERITVLHTNGMGGILKLYYGESQVGTRFTYGYSSTNPTTSSYTGGVSGHAIIFKSPLIFDSTPGGQTDYPIDPGEDYIWFITPLRWTIESGGVITETIYPDHTTIYNPTNYAASPLLHIKLPASHIMSNKPVALVNGGEIRLSFTSNNITVGSYSQPLSDLYIDCETMNAYTFLPYTDTDYDANKYVSLPYKDITLSPGENDIYINSNIEALEIVPRWWTT